MRGLSRGCVGFGLCWMLRWGCLGDYVWGWGGAGYSGVRELLGWERGFFCREMVRVCCGGGSVGLVRGGGIGVCCGGGSVGLAIGLGRGWDRGLLGAEIRDY